MRRIALLTFSAVVALASLPATAGEADRARQAIAEAQGKIDAGDKAGANGEAALIQTQARDALQSAKDRLNRGRKEEAITDAHHASELADRAIVVSQNRRVGEQREQKLSAEAQAAAAQQNAVAANNRADAATQQAMSAQQQADANARAAAAATAQADALRNVPPPAPVVVAQPTTTTTVVDREVVHRRAHTSVHRVVHHHPAVVADKTTVTTTTTPN
jgi:hypothetical protein